MLFLPGTGGDEATLWASDLMRMYERYAALKGWKLNYTSVSNADAGGYKEVVAQVCGGSHGCGGVGLGRNNLS